MEGEDEGGGFLAGGAGCAGGAGMESPLKGRNGCVGVLEGGAGMESPLKGRNGE